MILFVLVFSLLGLCVGGVVEVGHDLFVMGHLFAYLNLSLLIGTDHHQHHQHHQQQHTSDPQPGPEAVAAFLLYLFPDLGLAVGLVKFAGAAAAYLQDLGVGRRPEGVLFRFGGAALG